VLAEEGRVLLATRGKANLLRRDREERLGAVNLTVRKKGGIDHPWLSERRRLSGASPHGGPGKGKIPQGKKGIKEVGCIKEEKEFFCR